MSHAVQLIGSRRSCTVAHGMCWFSLWHGGRAVSAFITIQFYVIKSETFWWDQKEDIASVNFPWLSWGSDWCLQEVLFQGAVHSRIFHCRFPQPAIASFLSQRVFSSYTALCIFWVPEILPFFPKLCFLLFSQVVLWEWWIVLVDTEPEWLKDASTKIVHGCLGWSTGFWFDFSHWSITVPLLQHSNCNGVEKSLSD